MRKLLLVLAAAAVAIAIWFLSRPADAPQITTPATPATATASLRDASAVAEPSDASALAVADAPVAEGPVARRGGRIEGRVLDATGAARGGVALTLVDAKGQRLAAVTSDAKGGYALVDESLTAGSVTVGDVSQVLEPALAAGEVRHLDLIVGATREVVGFVLDLNGDPLGGVPVTLRSMAFEGRQAGLSRKNGTVVFARAPTSELRVEAGADGLGFDAGWVAAGPGRATVDLVLEPTADLTVFASPQDAVVLVRNSSPQAFGPDRTWLRSLAREQREQRARMLAAIDTLYPELRPADADGLSLDQLSAALDAAFAALPPDQLAALQARRTPERLAALAEAEARAVAALPAEPPGESEVERHSVVARGAPGTTFALPAGYRYELAVQAPGAVETWCGPVLLMAGDQRTVRCGQGGTARLSGRVVDVSGKALTGLQMELQVDRGGRPQRMVADAAGRFEVRVPLEGTNLATLAAALGDEVAFVRRNVVLAPGLDRDLGTLVVRRDADARPPTTPYAGTGGLVAAADNGVSVAKVERDSPLELAGIEPGDTLVAADGEPLAELSLPEVMDRLRGAEGSLVDLRVRNEDGELYDVTVERGVVVPLTDAMRGPE
ncbi:MAG: PDZ domain-containing protein [Myxococcota bacterium]